MSLTPPPLDAYFAKRGWAAFAFQREVWAAMAAGRSGLLHATTGAGKTLAVGLGALALAAKAAPGEASLRVLWITPMRALASDTARALEGALGEVAGLSVGLRTGDTDDKTRAAQRRRLPDVLVTTPESLTLMLAHPDTHARFAGLAAVVVDEWHELIANKRGVQVQLALARLRRWRPDIPVWGLSATLGDLDVALRALLGPNREGVLVRGKIDKTLLIDTALPAQPERIPWGGHLGLAMLPTVIGEIESAATSLVFTNTRSQAEIWYKEIIGARPDWAGIVALHHASLERSVRDFVEDGLKSGALKAVVCTSSLDLGVDFLPVERVLQIGSPKGVARLLQRAGRSGHAPGRPSRVTIVPSNSLEIVESAAAQQAVREGRIESLTSPDAPLDALAQHLVTIALGGGFRPDDLLPEIRDTVAFAHLSDADWRWALDFVRQGGPTLAAYPDFRRVEPDKEGVWRVPNARLAMMHRLNIGTITADVGIVVQYGPTPPGARLGMVEESFVARLRTGDKFWFAGKLLALARIRDSIAYVRPASGGRATVPRWGGGRMPLSTTLADAMVELMAGADEGRFEGAEMQAARPMLELQARWSALPAPDRLLAETLKTRDGWHLFVYPFAGRNVHLGMASLLAWRAGADRAGHVLARRQRLRLRNLERDRNEIFPPNSPTLLTPAASRDELRAQVLESLNAGELTRRQVPRHRPGLRAYAGDPSAGAAQRAADAGLFGAVLRRAAQV